MPPGTKRLRALGAFSAGRCMRLLKTFSASDFGFHWHEVGVWRSVLRLNEPGILRRTLGCPGSLMWAGTRREVAKGEGPCT